MNGAEMAFMVMVHVHTSFVVIICAALWFRAFIQILINNQSKDVARFLTRTKANTGTK